MAQEVNTNCIYVVVAYNGPLPAAFFNFSVISRIRIPVSKQRASPASKINGGRPSTFRNTPLTIRPQGSSPPGVEIFWPTRDRTETASGTWRASRAVGRYNLKWRNQY